jgi:hypothetical protein
MVSYDTTQIALFVSLVLTIAAIGTALVLGVLAQALIRSWRTRPARPESQRKVHGRLAFHH